MPKQPPRREAPRADVAPPESAPDGGWSAAVGKLRDLSRARGRHVQELETWKTRGLALEDEAARELEALERHATRLSDRVGELETERVQARAREAQHEAAALAQTREIGELRDRIGELEPYVARADEAARRVTQLESKCREIEAAKDVEIFALKKRTGELEPLVAQTSAMRVRITELEEDLRGRDEGLRALQQEKAGLLEDQRARILEQERTRDHLKQAQEAVREASVRQQESDKKNAADQADLLERLGEKKRKFEELQKWYGTLEREKEELQARLEEREARLRSLGVQVTELEGQLSTASQSLATHDVRIGDLMKVLEELKADSQAQRAQLKVRSSPRT
jgi:chromosome segregation ATPase